MDNRVWIMTGAQERCVLCGTVTKHTSCKQICFKYIKICRSIVSMYSTDFANMGIYKNEYVT